jgi:ATP-dependent Zn protease
MGAVMGGVGGNAEIDVRGTCNSLNSSSSSSSSSSSTCRVGTGAYNRAKQLLLDNRPALDALAKMLVEKETVTAEEFAQLLTECDVKISDYAVYQ